MAENETQLVVIGAGPGGYTAAFLAADMGMSVTMIDPEENPGGVCLYRGCIPSKALLHAAKMITESRDAVEWGIQFGKPKIDVKKLQERKAEVVKSLTGGLGQLVKQRKITYMRGKASFLDGHTLSVEADNGDQGKLTFENAIIATGSKSVSLPFADFDSDRIMNSAAALDLADVPKNFLVVGGGYIGLELGSVYAALGSKVSVVEMTPGLLPGADKDLVRVLQKKLTAEFEAIMLKTTVKEIKEQKNGLKVELEEEDGSRQNRLFDKVLVAVGRQPVTAGLSLESTSVELDDKGFIKVDAQQRTGESSVFAIGDVAGEPMLAHKAYHEARIAVEVISGKNVAYEPAAVPAVVFTDPEIAWAGLTENEAKEKKIEHQVCRFPWAASGRALTLGRSDGLTKLLVDPSSESILGVGMVGPGAGELIAEGVLAIEMGANVTDIGLSIHPHPTLSETFKEAAEVFHGISTHVYRKKRG